MRTIDIHQAKANLFALVDEAARGEPFVIAISGRPRVMVVPLDGIDARRARRGGVREVCLEEPEALDHLGQARIDRRCR